MVNNQRPTSPHLQIYRLPLTAVMSISHRATGVLLSLGLVLMVLLLSALAGGEESWTMVQGWLTSWFGMLVLFGFTLVLNYHLCYGIKHLFWDIGMGFSLEASSLSNKAVLAAAAILTALVWLIALSV